MVEEATTFSLSRAKNIKTAIAALAVSANIRVLIIPTSKLAFQTQNDLYLHNHSEAPLSDSLEPNLLLHC